MTGDSQFKEILYLSVPRVCYPKNIEVSLNLSAGGFVLKFMLYCQIKDNLEKTLLK